MRVETTVNDHIGEIRFSKPPFNYACPKLLEAIADAVEDFDRDAVIRVILLSSEGKAFCAGADLAGDADMQGGDGMESIAGLYKQASRLFRREKPMVAAIHGAAIGAGLGLALTADFRVAGPAARFSANFTRLGFHPGFALTHSLPRLIGEQRASWMMLSSARIRPEEALQWGLADRLCGDDVPSAARAMAAEVAANAPLALLAVRKTLMEGMADAVEAAMAREHAEQTVLKMTEDYAEGVASVFERRDAQFAGR